MSSSYMIAGSSARRLVLVSPNKDKQLSEMDRFLQKTKSKLREAANEHLGGTITHSLLGSGQSDAHGDQSSMAARPEPSENYPNAKRAVFWANDYFTSPGRIDQTEPELAKAERLLEGDYSSEAEALRKEIAELREKLADIVPSSEQAQLRNAERELKALRDKIEQQPKVTDGDREYIDIKLKQITDEILPRITHARKADQLKAPIMAEVARIRAQIAPVAPPAATRSLPPASTPRSDVPGQYQSRSVPQPSPPIHLDMAALSLDDQDCLDRARGTIGHARSNIESRRTDGVENLFYDATRQMAPVSDAHKAHLMAEIEQLRQELHATRLAERTRQITGELDRRLMEVEADGQDARDLADNIRSFKLHLGSDEVRDVLTPEMCRDYENRLANSVATGAAQEKVERLQRASPALQELRDKLASNLFTGVDQYSANRIDGDLRSLKYRVEKEINSLPEGDYDRQRIAKELADLDARWAAHSNEWAKDGVYATVSETWQMLRNDLEGWQQESFSASDVRQLEEPEMSKTRTAIRRVYNYLYNDMWVQRTRDENPGDFFIAGIDREASQLLAAAGGKMVAAYSLVLDAAEKMDPPIGGGDQWIRNKPGYLISSAECTFEKTQFLEPLVARIRALEQRWEDEMSGVQKSRDELQEKLTLEALQRWPAIIGSIPTVSSFDPGSAQPGDAVHLKGVYNRSGWDFDGNQYGFSMRYNGVPLGGIYEDYINKALDHAVYELKLRIDDHKEWDVVGVVLGPGSIKERTKRTIRLGMDYTEVEEWLPIECLRLRIIALRAGPVVVGPQT